MLSRYVDSSWTIHALVASQGGDVTMRMRDATKRKEPDAPSETLLSSTNTAPRVAHRAQKRAGTHVELTATRV
jgi:hypothetical protein